MDPERERIQEDLRGLLEGDVRCDDLTLQIYASDASIYELKPLGVVRPRHTADVVACLQYAHTNQIPIHARGAGTGLAGESLGRGLVIDFSCHMRRIVRSDAERVRVQPGVVLDTLNRHLAVKGRQFGPDPAMSHVTTMGSVVAIDAAGSHWLRYGSARRHVESLQIVLADGHVLEVGREPVRASAAAEDDLRRHDLVAATAGLITREADLIAAGRRKSVVNRCGYMLHDVLADGHLNLARLLVGSEGTLALVTEATLATQPLPQNHGVVLLLFDRLENAARAVQEILKFRPSACDLMDRRHLSLARESDVRYDLLIPAEAEAVLLVEQEADTVDQVRQSLVSIVERIRKKLRLAFDSHLTLDAEDVAFYWRLARKYVPTLYRLKGSTRPLPFIEDIAVPPQVLPEFLVELQNILKRHQVTASLFGHVGHGQLHVRPFLDLANVNNVARMEQLASELYQHVIDVGGTISGEHAAGLSRTPFLRQQYGPLCDVFRELKRIFDPIGILNPGKIVALEPVSMTSNLRPTSYPLLDTLAAPEPAAENGPTPLPTLQLQLAWGPQEMAHMARHCNGCGACRSQQGDVRMCPIFHIAPKEESSPRAKANVLRSVLSGSLPHDTLTKDDFKELADLCVHCHQCRLECPASVDIPKLMIESKAAYVRTNGLRPSDWFMSRIDTLSGYASTFPSLANWTFANRQARWVMEKIFGIAQGRKLPRAAPRSFLRVAARKRWNRPIRRTGTKVLYFVDTYANYHDTQLAEALVRVFEHNSTAVYVHPDQKSAGMPLIAQGVLDRARQIAEHNVQLLADAVRQGYQIVASEPSAVLALTREYRQLIDDDDSRVVAENTIEACQYLWNLHRQGRLQLDFRPLSAVLAYHMPCHLKALEIGSPGENLLRLIPGLLVHHTERGCSGMAGTFGLKRENYRNSLRAGWGLISALREPNIQAGVTECSTCKIQMEQGASKPTIHPIKLLAAAYGLMPELAQLLTAPSEELLVT